MLINNYILIKVKFNSNEVWSASFSNLIVPVVTNECIIKWWNVNAKCKVEEMLNDVRKTEVINNSVHKWCVNELEKVFNLEVE